MYGTTCTSQNCALLRIKTPLQHIDKIIAHHVESTEVRSLQLEAQAEI